MLNACGEGASGCKEAHGKCSFNSQSTSGEDGQGAAGSRKDCSTGGQDPLEVSTERLSRFRELRCQDSRRHEETRSHNFATPGRSCAEILVLKPDPYGPLPRPRMRKPRPPSARLSEAADRGESGGARRAK